MTELKSPFIKEEKIYIDDIPVLVLRPKMDVERFPTIMFYHGWSSNKESQRMRAYILCNLGFQVLLPDSINHGERNPIDYMGPNSMRNYFWQTVLNSVEESVKLINYTIDNLDGDKDKIGVSGHSMGGFISSGVFTHNIEVKASVILNGSCNWKHSNELIAGKIGEDLDIPMEAELKQVEAKWMDLDPINHIEKIQDRALLLLNGGSDEVVPLESQKQFYEKSRKTYSDKSMINLIVYNKLGHFVTTNMMEDTSRWFKNFL